MCDFVHMHADQIHLFDAVALLFRHGSLTASIASLTRRIAKNMRHVYQHDYVLHQVIPPMQRYFSSR